jgi:hypothetical protein
MDDAPEESVGTWNRPKKLEMFCCHPALHKHASVNNYSFLSDVLFKESSNPGVMLVSIVDLEFCHERSGSSLSGGRL